MWRRRWACRWVCRRDARRGRAKGPVQAFPEGAIASLPGKIRKGESLNKKALRVSAFFVQRASATLWLARGRELPALVRVAVPRLLALVLLLFVVAAALGLPVLSGGRGGLAPFMSPSAGYLNGFAPPAFVTGWF